MTEVERVITLCDSLIHVGKDLENYSTVNGSSSSSSSSSSSGNSTSDGFQTRTNNFKQAALATLHLKHLNREILQSLDVKRRYVENEKDKLEVLKLKLENLLYKRAYLLREIQVLQDLTTPNLQSVEKEIGSRLAVSSSGEDRDITVAAGDKSAGHASNLEAIEKLAEISMTDEIAAREADMKTLAVLTEAKQAREAVLDRKRKFLDDVPMRMSKIQTTFLDDLQRQFDTFRKEVLGIGEEEADEVEDEGEGEKEGGDNGDEGTGEEENAVKVDGADGCVSGDSAMDVVDASKS